MAHMDRNQFQPTIITLYDEIDNESDLDKFIELGIEHYKVPLSKKDVILGKTASLKKKIQELNPDLIHSMGVFPDYAVARMNLGCQVITLHNYMHDDYIAKFGMVQGSILEMLQMYAIKKAKKVWTCSESLSKIYMEKRKLKFDFIRNGVDISKYRKAESQEEKDIVRESLGLPLQSIIFTYTGQFIERKDQGFLIDLFNNSNELKNHILLLLGDGPNFDAEKKKGENNKKILFTGNVSNVNQYLLASDYYISCSHSEGLPTSVLEALSCGLPVILSDILQHKEILEIDERIGISYKLGDSEDCKKAIMEMQKKDLGKASIAAYDCAYYHLSAETMSETYQKEYLKVINEQ